MAGGPLIPLDWLSMPEFVQRWYSSGLPPLTLPVGGPRGGIRPRVPQSPAAEVPRVVPRRDPTFNNPTPPPIIPARLPNIPTGTIRAQDDGDTKVALSDWLEAGVAVANAWGQQPASQVFSYSGATPGITSMPTITSPAPGQMGDNGHWVAAGCKRRRRQRNILTQANIGIMWQISSLPNNANVRIALAKAIR